MWYHWVLSTIYFRLSNKMFSFKCLWNSVFRLIHALICNFFYFSVLSCFHCVYSAFCVVCLLGGNKGIRPVKTKWWGAGMVICLEWGADLHTAQLMPLPLTASCFSKIQMVLPFWYRLTRVVLDKGPLNGYVYVLCCLFICGCFLA